MHSNLLPLLLIGAPFLLAGGCTEGVSEKPSFPWDEYHSALASSAASGPSSYRQLAIAFGASYSAARLADKAASRCRAVSPGSQITPNGQTIQWTGPGRMSQIAIDCQRTYNELNLKIKTQHPGRVTDFEREMANSLSTVEADTTEFVDRSMNAALENRLLGCYILQEALVVSAGEACGSR